MLRNESFLAKAEALKPTLLAETVRTRCEETWMGKGGKILVDFGKHLVGCPVLNLVTRGAHPDAPAWLRLRFAERLSELEEDPKAYHGWISASWVQMEEIHVDVFPAVVRMDRRYAFRYLEVEVLDLSSKYEICLEEAACETVSSADEKRLLPYAQEDPVLRKIDQISVDTLHDCMQLVFEDGPKRDRRLWIGDLRLQALVNYETYHQNDLVKRCLYLFAGDTLPEGRVSAAMFLEPEIEADDTCMFDYSLFFVPTLLDYFRATDDLETLRELWPTAWHQIELAWPCFDENGLVRDSDRLGWCFTDWNLGLNKQASAQGSYLYALRAGMEIVGALLEKQASAEALAGLTDQRSILEREYEQKMAAAKRYLFDPELGLFVSGADRQISYASQVWMVLGGFLEDPEILGRLKGRADALGMVTPYMYHHFVQALLDLGKRDEALKVIREYWGGMVDAGADTFWEMFDPADPNASPYGGTIVNSYCHAWSCGPAYFLRKYFR